MTLFDWYLFRALVKATLAVIAVIGGLDFSFALIAELDDLDAGYGLFQALQYVGTTLPRRLYEVLPFCILIGTLIGLGGCAEHNELVTMRSAGWSPWRLCGSALLPAAGFVAVGLLLGEWLAPLAEQRAETTRVLSQGGAMRSVLRQGVWVKQNDGFVHINGVSATGEVIGFSRFVFDEQRQLQTATFAARAQHGPAGWTLHERRVTRFAESGTTATGPSEGHWRSALTPKLLRVLAIKPERLASRDLRTYITYLRGQQLNADRYRLALWRKRMQPLAIGVLVLLGASFVFGPLRAMPTSARVLSGALTGVGFFFAQNLLGSASLVYGFAPWFGAALPLALGAGIAVLLLRRVH